MKTVLVTPPSVEPVSLAEAKAHLRVDHANDDDLISAMVTAARQHLDAEGHGWLGRALCTQIWDLYLDAFPDCTPYGYGKGWERHAAIRLPFPPLQQVMAVTYVDPDGVVQTWSPAGYTVAPGEPALVYPARNETWPTARMQPDAVKLRFAAGYVGSGSPSDTADGVPSRIKSWIKLRLGDLYENRESFVTGTIATELPGIDGMLNGLRVDTIA